MYQQGNRQEVKVLVRFAAAGRIEMDSTRMHRITRPACARITRTRKEQRRATCTPASN